MRFTFRVERGAGGRPAVKRDRVETATKEGIVVARIAIRLEDPPGTERGADPRWKLGRLVVAGERADFRLELDDKPAELRVDPRGESFALFFDEKKSRKRTQQLLAVEAAARGDAAEAGDVEAQLYLAIAALESGRKEAAQRAVAAAEKAGGDVAALEDLLKG